MQEGLPATVRLTPPLSSTPIDEVASADAASGHPTRTLVGTIAPASYGVVPGLVGMCVHEHRTLAMQPHAAYGEQVSALRLNPGEKLMFDLVLLTISAP